VTSLLSGRTISTSMPEILAASAKCSSSSLFMSLRSKFMSLRSKPLLGLLLAISLLRLLQQARRARRARLSSSIYVASLQTAPLLSPHHHPSAPVAAGAPRKSGAPFFHQIKSLRIKPLLGLSPHITLLHLSQQARLFRPVLQTRVGKGLRSLNWRWCQ